MTDEEIAGINADAPRQIRGVIDDARETLALAMESPLENAHQIDQLNELIDEALELIR